jgi:uncharacterized protein YndB with AHSA1/START domain
MTSNLVFDFTVDKTTNTILIHREFAAKLALVWDAFTKPEILDQWGAPAPFTAHTIYMNFIVGGRRFYKMVSPEGLEHYSVQDYTVITPMSNLQYISGFSDKDEQVNPTFYGSINNLNFSEANSITTVSITIQYTSLAILEMMVEKGFKEGFTLTMSNLEMILARQ